MAERLDAIDRGLTAVRDAILARMLAALRACGSVPCYGCLV